MVYDLQNYIVLLKEVPDITQISDDAFNPETGTLIRSKLDGVVNALDTQALAFAAYMRALAGRRGGEIVAITMGQPSAEEVLRYSLARRADKAILLTDKKLGGADTWATANSLSSAIKKTVNELFEGNEDYFIISGMQSIDGDTAQVPPQIAAALGAGCNGYVTGVDCKDGRFEFTRIASGGNERVAVKSLPAVITVAQYDYPLFASFKSTRRAKNAEIIRWGAEDIQARQIGTAGSKTQVIEIFPPPKSARKRRQIQDVEQFVRKIYDCLKTNPGSLSQQSPHQKKYILPAKRQQNFDRSFEITSKENAHYAKLIDKLLAMGIDSSEKLSVLSMDELCGQLKGLYHETTLIEMLEGLKCQSPFYSGDVWVVAEIDGEKVHKSTFELIAEARFLADCLEKKVGVVVAAADGRVFAEELISAGADTVYLAEHPMLEFFEPVCYAKAVGSVLEKYKPQIVLLPATPQGRLLAPMTAFRLGCGLTADCTSLEIADISKKKEIAVLKQTRPALGGNIMASIYAKNSSVQMATVRPGVFKPLAKSAREGSVVEHNLELDNSDAALHIIESRSNFGKVSFGVDLIVCGGKGLKTKAGYDEKISSLIQAAERGFNVAVEKGASRAAVEQGFIQRDYQIGQTGTAVAPKVYLGLAVSGAVQHTIGIANAERVFAVNSDPEAPIFKNCDYYLVGSLEEVLPKMLKAIEHISERRSDDDS